MSQGLFTAVGGIKANQAKIDVISDNIANMNTVGFKSSQVNFENIFVKTLSSGSAPSASRGGTNPIQVGLGVAVGEVNRNFNGGSIQTTGKSTDLNIQGQGFFTVSNPDGGILLTRGGNFTVDGDGSLVTAKGLKVLGTASLVGTTASTTPVQIPQSLNLVKPITDGTTAITNVSKDGAPMTEGTFTIDDGNGTPVVIDTTGKTLQQVITSIDGCFSGLTASMTDGILTIENTTGGNISLTSGTSNFLNVLGAPAALADGESAVNATAFKDDAKITISPPDSTANTYALSSISIGKSGAIEATYSNGDKLTVSGEPTRSLAYKTATGIEMAASDISVTGSAVTPAQLQLQMGNVVNPKGLVSTGGNLFSVGPNAGQQSFSAAGFQGMGSIDAGSLETSNVDLTSEFAELIIAQRGIDANGKAFDAQNNVMRTIVNIGR